MLKYYIYSPIFDEQFAITEKEATDNGNYLRAYFENNHIVKSELVNNNKVNKVIYYTSDFNNPDLLLQHKLQYPSAQFEVSSFKNETDFCEMTVRYYNDENEHISTSILTGKKIWAWEKEERFGANGEKWESIQYIYNEGGDLIKEAHYKSDGSFFYEEDLE